MNPTPDYYAVLGLQPTASPDQIKAAYRAVAKQAHPDAGGSPEAMQAVNEAYQTLSNPAARRDYDQLRADQANPPAPNAPPDVQAAYDAREAQLQAAMHRKLRRAQARRSAWNILKSNIVAALLLGILTRFFIIYAPTLGQKLFLSFIGYVPAYLTLVGVVFMIDPDLRLAVHDLADDLTNRRRPRRQDLNVLLGLAGSFILLGGIWLLFLS